MVTISKIKKLLNIFFIWKILGNSFLEVRDLTLALRYLLKLEQVYLGFGSINTTHIQFPWKLMWWEELLGDPTLYVKLAGSLFYLTIIRPDICYVVHTINKFMQPPDISTLLLFATSFDTSLAHLFVTYSSLLVF
jgi:hypothetical protein